MKEAKGERVPASVLSKDRTGSCSIRMHLLVDVHICMPCASLPSPR